MVSKGHFIILGPLSIKDQVFGFATGPTTLGIKLALNIVMMFLPQEVGRCRTRGEFVESVLQRQQSMQERRSALALKSRADVNRSPKTGNI